MQLCELRLGTFHYAYSYYSYGTDYGVALNYAVIVHLSYFLILVFCSIFLYIFTGPPIGFKETNLRQVILKFKSGWAINETLRSSHKYDLISEEAAPEVLDLSSFKLSVMYHA